MDKMSQTPPLGMYWAVIALVMSCHAAKTHDRIKHIVEDSVRPEYRCPHGPETNRLYPFGLCVNDTMLPRTDDGYEEFKLQRKIRFYGKEYDELYICNNGLVAFEFGVSLAPPSSMKKAVSLAHPFIAPFWTDVDSRGGTGRVYYRQIVSGETFVKIERRVKESLALESFNMDLAVIVTWYNVAAHPPEGGAQNTYLRNTFQLVLASDGPRLVGFYIYQDIGWALNEDNGPAPVVGSDAGDIGTHNFYAPQSFTVEAMSMAKVTNVLFRNQSTLRPKEGVWVSEYYLAGANKIYRSVLKCLQERTCCVSDGIAFITDDCVNYTMLKYRVANITDNVHEHFEFRKCEAPNKHFNVHPTVCSCDKIENAAECKYKWRHNEL